MARRTTRPLLTVLGLAGSAGLVLSAPAAASIPVTGAASGSATVKLSADAWYSATVACTSSPTGCLPADLPASPYPAKTLHVGVAGGQEESRSYLALDLASLPAGTSLTGGTLRLPVGGNDDGSVAPDTATLQACLVLASFKDSVEGSTQTPPKVDCKTSAPAKYIAAAGTAPAAFTVDLGVFAAAWRAGTPDQGIALLPATGTAPTSAWHVAMSAHDRTGSAIPAPSATVSYAAGAAAGGDFTSPTSAPAAAAGQGTSSVSFAAPPLAPQSSVQTAVQAPAAQPVVAPQTAPAAPTQQFAPQAFVGTGTFAYPGVFLLPLLFAGACGWLGRMMTRDLTAV